MQCVFSSDIQLIKVAEPGLEIIYTNLAFRILSKHAIFLNKCISVSLSQCGNFE